MGKVTLLSASEAAAYRGIGVRQVQRLAEKGLFPVAAYGPRNALFFKKSDIRYAPVSLRG